MYNVSEDPSIQDGTAADALENAPGVEVDIEGNITLRGVSSVEIWLNDRPSHLTEENLKEFIQQLPANSLERIEVITNPSAKYSSKSDAGIINIVTTSEIKKNSFLSFGLRASSSPNVTPWVSYVWANQKLSLNFYLNGTYSMRKTLRKIPIRNSTTKWTLPPPTTATAIPRTTTSPVVSTSTAPTFSTPSTQ